MVFLAMQLIRVKHPQGELPGNGTIHEHVAIPANIDAILRRSCYDCHSAQTRWPWYSKVAPVSWMITRHVREGRSNLDFDRWSTDPDIEPTPQQRLRGICRDVQKKIMPPGAYALVQPKARLSQQDVQAIGDWSK